MQLSSAFLALALQCSPSLHTAPLDPIVTSQVFIQPNVSSVYGSVLPCPEQKLGVTVTTAVQGKKGIFAKDQVLITATSLHLAEADLGEIVPGLMQDSKTITVGVGQPVQPAPPTYESWDVLRQYPRTAPLAEPRISAPKPPENSKPSKDSKDAQGKTATE